MFTGIVEETGRVKAVRRGSTEAKLIISACVVLGKKASMSDPANPGIPTRIGDSICVNGVCLTVTAMDSASFTADVMPETFSRSSLGSLRPGQMVNLERAMPAYGRFGGHIVSGHIDGTGKILEVKRDGNAVWYRIRASADIIRLIVEKGSIAIDGISLTVADVSAGDQTFRVSVIPHTLAVTALAERKPGDTVNLETDIIGKYAAKLMEEYR